MNIRRPILVLLVAVGLSVVLRAGNHRSRGCRSQSAVQEMASRFEKDTGKTVKVIYGSSGNFFQQIQNGAPSYMLLSANLDYPRRLEAAGIDRYPEVTTSMQRQDRDLGSQRV